MTATPEISAPDRVAHQMMHMVLEGRWPSGEQIPPERELVDHFDASRATVRTATARLANWGVLVARQGSGTVVQPRTQWQLGALTGVVRAWLETGEVGALSAIIRDALEIRRAVVEDLLRRAAPRLPADCFDDLRAVVLRAWQAREDGALFLRRDHEFFGTILDAAQMSASQWLVNELRRTYEALALELGASGATADYVQHHNATIDALQRGDGDAAVVAFGVYLDQFTDHLKTHLPPSLAEIIMER